MFDNTMQAMNLPRCMADDLGRGPDSRAVVADARRAATARGEAVAQALRAVGISTTKDGADRWRQRVPPLTEAQRAEIRRRRELIQAGAFRSERRLRSNPSE